MSRQKRHGGINMVKHIILWQLQENLSAEEKLNVLQGIKEGLESLKGKITGLLDIHVQITPLSSSNADVLLDSSFEDEAALQEYAIHPEHVKVANEKVRPFTKVRMCMDYKI